jgi:DNA-binding beta-propeller fold protein YncE
MRARVIGATCLAAGGLLGCGERLTEPETALPERSVVHVAATITRTPVTGRPFGVGVSVSRVAYVGRQDEDRLTRFDLPGTTAAGDVSVGRDPGDVAFQPDGQRAFVTHVLGTDVGVVDVASGTQVDAIATGPTPLRVLVSPTGSFTYITNAAGNLLVVDPTTLSIVNTVFSGSVANGLAVNASGSLVYVSSASSGLLTEHQPDGTPTGRSFSLGGVPQDVWVAPNGDVWVANEAGRIDLVRPSTGGRGTIPLTCGAFGLRGVQSGRLVIVTCSSAGLVLAFRRSDKVLISTLNVGGTPRRVGEDVASRTIIVPNEGNWVDFIR